VRIDDFLSHDDRLFLHIITVPQLSLSLSMRLVQYKIPQLNIYADLSLTPGFYEALHFLYCSQQIHLHGSISRRPISSV
jgi:hypothetical protein